MMLAVILATLVAIPLLAIVSFVQVLYLESMRLRTRDLPALKFFKETLEDKFGMKTERGAGAFSLVKHTLLLLVGICYFAWIADGQPWNWETVWQAGLAAWLTMMAVSYALPQLLYRRTKAKWLVPLVPFLRGVAWVALPFEALLSLFQSLIDLADDASAASGSKKDAPTAAENIEALISAGAEEGLIEEEDRELIQSVVEFGDKVVREVMTPRPNIVAISADATLEQLRQLVITEQYSRIPAYEQNIDQVIGFVHVRDMFELEEEERERRTVRELLRPILFVPETKPVSDLMRQMQQENTHMVIVVDEYGNTAGLATMEDLLEVIIGEIRDEHEPDSDVTEDGAGGYIVSGNFDLDRVGDLFEGFHREADIESTTVGGLLTEWLGRVPGPGDFVEHDGVRFEALAGDELRVTQVKISKAHPVAHE
jgi:putative hemolysin